MSSAIKKVFYQFLYAIVFLTRVPLPFAKQLDKCSLKDCLWSFPLVGLLIGGVGGLLFALLAWAGFNLALSLLLVMAIIIVITGALHEDGLADFCDGLGVMDREKSLTAMRDSRVGTFGVIGLVFTLLWKGAALFQLGNAGLIVMALIVSHAGGRGLMAPLFLLPFAGQKGLAYAAGNAGRHAVINTLIITLIILVLLLPLTTAFITFILGLGVVGLVGSIAMRKFGGVTGDVYGAAEQLVEIVILSVFVMMV